MMSIHVCIWFVFCEFWVGVLFTFTTVPNRKNGSSSKKVKTPAGEFE
jgi:hypothetical protein